MDKYITEKPNTDKAQYRHNMDMFTYIFKILTNSVS